MGKNSCIMSKELTTLLLLLLVFCCQAQSSNAEDGQLGHHTNPNCTHVHTALKGETCLTLGAANNISQAQLLQVNPGLNCKTLKEGHPVCINGTPSNCRRTIVVEKGSMLRNGRNSSCESIASKAGLSLVGLNVLNPGLSCPEAPENHDRWPSSRKLCVEPGSGTVFIEYMGAMGGNLTFDSVQPLVTTYKGPIYHFALAFAIDMDRNGTLQNGNFTPYWSHRLTPEATLAFKAANPDVRILMSLGGAELYTLNGTAMTVIWEDPSNVEDWINNAQASLTAIADAYSIDGIDIDYESFPNNNATFAYCIGTLIQRLKGNKTIGLATIAPFGDEIPAYLQLMEQYGDLIDYVNFQFYAYELPTVEDYLTQYDAAAGMFDPWKLLASTEINSSRCIVGHEFEQAVEQLQQKRGLRGVMLWAADTSLPYNFTDEKLVLALLSYESGHGPAPSSPSPSLAPSQTVPPSPSPALPLPGSSSAQGNLLSGYRSAMGFLTTLAVTVFFSLYAAI